MLNIFPKLAYRSLLLLDPEIAHNLSIVGLKSGLFSSYVKNDPRLKVEVNGISFPNPLGMAAGYDKNAKVPIELMKIGFGFVEIGTITPNPQEGNPRPRIFRLINDKAIINQLGFNNTGYHVAFSRLAKIKKIAPIGINIGANKNSNDFVSDYVSGIRQFFTLASYFSINISSPNTPGLRNLQTGKNLERLLSNVMQTREEEREKTGKSVPIFLKISPDLSEKELDDIAKEVLSHNIEGLIISNTTVSREGLRYPVNYAKTGGLSGSPLFSKSTKILAKMRRRVGPNMTIIGCGGISSTQDAIEKIMAGANIIQLYSAMIYEGISLPNRIIRGLSCFLDRENTSLDSIRSTRTDHWANQEI
ncbi:MAG: dihydroorotate dehydrogenase (quinone) [Candidatus Liberibacter europaeus]|uniref:Dihydroorotate dehydrogenase (quinone) n=1 Tax=Candidatus Liberibacter europaeus TaxID=744859 RepID=A0A2T4VYT0_9HYPH|nr:dihydroorotate dehydrogenase (quinone) [Candidatus Liberibacter europaeus]PTL86937.1 MAG: dihydroorotate dehydrogenase (quinone) [Candidatus Liberibacter europaeus]